MFQTVDTKTVQSTDLTAAELRDKISFSLCMHVRWEFMFCAWDQFKMTGPHHIYIIPIIFVFFKCYQ